MKSTRTVPHISYAEAAQLARLGARVMHPKMIEPVIARQIPIRILNSHAPQQRGTLISAEAVQWKWRDESDCAQNRRRECDRGLVWATD